MKKILISTSVVAILLLAIFILLIPLKTYPYTCGNDKSFHILLGQRDDFYKAIEHERKVPYNLSLGVCASSGTLRLHL